MGTDFSVMRQYIQAAWLQAHGSDPTTVRVRYMLGRLLDDVLRAENGRPTASFAFIRQQSTPGYTHRLSAISWSFAGKLAGDMPFGAG